MTKRALICGVSGQDGAYLASYLLGQGYTIFGSSRDAELSSFSGLTKLGVRDQVTTLSMALGDFRSVLQVLSKIEVDEIYNLAGQSSVGLSFEQPLETLESISVGTLNVLEAIRLLKKPTRFYNAGSSECFGDTGSEPANEQTAFRPRSPYAVAKAAAFWQVANYREAYGMHACSGILFNHESPLRPDRFVTQKIARAVARIANGDEKELRLGNLSLSRDWGWAPDYVEAMHAMLQRDEPEDFVIATGRTETLETFVAEAFQVVNLDWRDHVVSDERFMRPSDIPISRADPSHANKTLNWTARTVMPEVTKRLVEAALLDIKG